MGSLFTTGADLFPTKTSDKSKEGQSRMEGGQIGRESRLDGRGRPQIWSDAVCGKVAATVPSKGRPAEEIASAEGVATGRGSVCHGDLGVLSTPFPMWQTPHSDLARRQLWRPPPAA
ncbi:hypothetical protein GUJ93_ZPchr0008g14016 [Zizania palustris]|uniref:Uncharacterized protein n=1 Tax=Zizania palustris TaxID=103762 RepID=A0A8J5UWT5_ZIZPA|nr:hypothetical protein GUJ93_ZPchr0008g14016 [Zizania palustris]